MKSRFSLKCTLAGLMAALAVGEAQATCSKRPDSQVRPIINSFLFRPGGLLERYPNGERDLSGTIRDLVAVDPRATLQPVLDLVRMANSHQKNAIGAGIAAATRLCLLASEPDSARRLQEAVRGRDDRELTAGFFTTLGGQAPLAQVPKAANAEPTNPLSRPYVSSPDVNPFKTNKLPNILDPVR